MASTTPKMPRLIYLFLVDQLGVFELVIWDKGMFKEKYLSKISLPLEG